MKIMSSRAMRRYFITILRGVLCAQFDGGKVLNHQARGWPGAPGLSIEHSYVSIMAFL